MVRKPPAVPKIRLPLNICVAWSPPITAYCSGVIVTPLMLATSARPSVSTATSTIVSGLWSRSFGSSGRFVRRIQYSSFVPGIVHRGSPHFTTTVPTPLSRTTMPAVSSSMTVAGVAPVPDRRLGNWNVAVGFVKAS